MNPGDRVQIINPKSKFHMETGVIERYTTYGDIIVLMDSAKPPAYYKVPFSPWDVQPLDEEVTNAGS